jgi:hypothetical protein
MALVEAGVLRRPSLLAPARSKQGGMIVADHDGFVDTPRRKTVAP